MEVKYEDFLYDPNRIMSTLLKFCGLSDATEKFGNLQRRSEKIVRTLIRKNLSFYILLKM